MMHDHEQIQPVFVIHGERVKSLEDFYQEIGEAVNGPGGYFGANLDALWDCLRGGFGTPEEGGYTIRWLNCKASQQALGYEETVRQLDDRLKQCHPASQEQVQRDITRARHHEGPTAFDWLVDLLRQAKMFGAELELH